MSLSKGTPVNRNHTLADRVSVLTGHAQDAIVETATKAMNAAEAVSQTAVETLDQRRGAAAQVLAQTASAIRDDAAHIAGGVASVANSAAAQVEATATYVRRRTIRQMTGDLTRLVKRHPASAVMIATAIGVVLGRAMAIAPPRRARR